jgi:hypothetical protein
MAWQHEKKNSTAVLPYELYNMKHNTERIPILWHCNKESFSGTAKSLIECILRQCEYLILDHWFDQPQVKVQWI